MPIPAISQLVGRAAMQIRGLSNNVGACDLNILYTDADLVAAIVGGFEVRRERGGVAGVV